MSSQYPLGAVTLSDGTFGPIAGAAPARSITWSNGITYTEVAPAVAR